MSQLLDLMLAVATSNPKQLLNSVVNLASLPPASTAEPDSVKRLIAAGVTAQQARELLVARPEHIKVSLPLVTE